MTLYKPYFHSFYKRAPITQPLVSKSELASPLPPHREQFTSQVLITRSDTQKLELANLVLHLQLFSSVQFSRSVASDSLRPHGLQHTRIPCPSPTPEACSNSCPSSGWYHPTMSSSVVPFSSCLHSFPLSGSFPVTQLFTSGGQSMGASASASVLNIQDWFPLGWTGWISLQSNRLSRVFPNTTVQKHQFFSSVYTPTLLSIHDYWKTITLTRWTFISKVMSLPFNMLSF